MYKKAQHSFEEDSKDCNDSMSIGSFSKNSMNSVYSSSLDLTDQEVTSSLLISSSLASSHSNGPLYELSDLMNHLPIKRGLSMFYEGKAQSFTSLAMVERIEDLPKKCTSQRKRIKSCKSYIEGLHSQTISFKISKKASRGSNFVSKRGVS
ncbi:PREDICTED: uncharacterized protein LOC109358438 [Lupinus angustifolius]|uniref:uncharacterized protein LOC109358438 n=1 Tax=Lupinus angustifolius TaxID=3871 RepID=UPI00092EA08D|nr:PREDICTED: uncharacterized protein LOC109358438 [Lupinus angustifolius]